MTQELKIFKDTKSESQMLRDALFLQSLDGVFLMMLDKPIKWDEKADKEKLLDYIFKHQKITRINSAMLEQYRSEEKEFIGKTPADFFSHNITEGRRIWAKLFDEGKLHIETDERRFDGTQMFVDGDYICIYDDESRICGHIGIQRDITAQKSAMIALKEQEENYRNFFNTIDEMLFVLDMSANIIWCNQSVYRTLGYSESELQGNSVLAVHPPQWRTKASITVKNMLEGKEDFCPIPLLSKYGDYIPVETRVSIGKWNGSDVIFGVSRNLSQVKASEEKFSAAFHYSPVLMAITDLKTGKYLEVNEYFLKILGFKREDVIGKTGIELNIFCSNEDRNSAVSVLFKNGVLEDYPLEIKDSSGKIHQGIFSGRILDLQDRKLVLTIMNDITEKTKIEKEGRKINEHYRELMTHIQAGVLVENENRKIVHINPLFAKIFKIESPESVIGMDCSIAANFSAPLFADPDLFITRITEILNNQEVVTCEEILLKDGGMLERDYIPVSIDGEFLGNMWIYRDVTQRKRMEEQLRYREKMAAIGQITAGIGHDFNNILTTVIGYTDLLLLEGDGLGNPDLREIKKSGEKMAFLVRQLMDYSRQTANQYRRLNLGEFLNEMPNYLVDAGKCQTTPAIEIIPGNYTVFSDTNQLKQLIFNIYDNACFAVLHLPENERSIIFSLSREEHHGKLECSVCRNAISGNYIKISVSDNGTGISEEHIDHIFEPFFTTREVGKGSGLGLSQAAGIVSQYDGHMTVTTSTSGTTFNIFLPDKLNE